MVSQTENKNVKYSWEGETLTGFVSVVEFVSEAVREEETLRERVDMPGQGSAGQETEARRQYVDDQQDHVGPLQAHVRRPGHFLHPPDC